jgi:hypothetical protein
LALARGYSGGGGGRRRSGGAPSFPSSSPAAPRAAPLRVLLLHATADCAGLTLTAANHLFLLDAVLSAATLAQLVGRICRVGQRKPCVVYHLCGEGEGGTDEAIMRLRALRERDGTAEEAGGGGGGGGGARLDEDLSLHELLDVLLGPGGPGEGASNVSS